MPEKKKQLREWDAAELERGRRSARAWQRFFERERDEVESAEEIEQTARVGEAIDRHEGELLKLPGVAGVGVSLKEKKGRPTGEIALTVFVEKKRRRKKLGDDAVPRELDSVETDVVEVGRLEPLAFDGRVRPAMPGYSIGHANVTAGTFGCLVRDLQSPNQQHLVLGNNHVLADTNRGRLGDPILQPGPYDGGDDARDTVAILERFEPIHFGLGGDAYNLVDAAVARPVSQRQVTASVIGSLMPQSVGQAFLGDRVIKAGRTTGVTRGRVISVNATVIVWFPETGGDGLRPAVFRHQILTTFMSVGGDSGSLLMDRHLGAIGLIYAGSPLFTVASHIADVESALGVRTLTAPRPSSELREIRRQLRRSQPALEPERPPGSQPSPPPEEDDSGPQPSPPPEEDDSGPQPAPPPEEDDAGPQPAPPPEEDDAGPQPVPPPEEDDAGPQLVLPPREDDSAPARGEQTAEEAPVAKEPAT